MNLPQNDANAELLAAASAVLGDMRQWVACVARSNGFNHEKTRRAESRLHALGAAIEKAKAAEGHG